MKSKRLLDDLTILSLFYVALGAVLLGWPEVSSQIICCAFGAVLAVAGAVRIVRYFIKDKLDGLIRRDLAVGLSLVIAGVFLLVRPDSVLSLLPLLFGLLLLGGGASKLQTAVDLRRIDPHRGNAPMRRFLEKLGFQECGVIFLEDPGEPTPERIAYQKILLPPAGVSSSC